MKYYFFKVLLFFIILISCPAYAEYNKICYLNDVYHTSPSINGCIIKSNSYGKIILNNKCKSLFKAGEGEKKQYLKELNFNNNTPILLVNSSNEGYSSKFNSQGVFKMPSFEIPFIGKNENNIIRLDTGMSIKLKVRETANLYLSGMFGSLKMKGKCKPYNTNISNSASSTHS